jgi:excinuclease ABC subunit C
LIDGGLGHLRAAGKALKAMEAPPVRIASIAKKQEDIYIQDTSEPLKLPARSPALRLLQYVRDEAHRFAQHYHHILRGKKMFGSRS